MVILRVQQTKNLILIFKRTIMKKVLTLTLMGLMLTVVLAACGSSKGGHCDAYGSIDQVENNDLAKL